MYLLLTEYVFQDGIDWYISIPMSFKDVERAWHSRMEAGRRAFILPIREVYNAERN